MERVRPDAIALWQEGVGRSVHHLIARGKLWVWAKKVRNPPRLQRTVDSKEVGDPKPPEEPWRTGPPEVNHAARESDGNRSEVEEGDGEKLAAREHRPSRSHVIERSERNPIVECHEQHSETLKPKQRASDGDGMHNGPHYTALFGFSSDVSFFVATAPPATRVPSFFRSYCCRGVAGGVAGAAGGASGNNVICVWEFTLPA